MKHSACNVVSTAIDSASLNFDQQMATALSASAIDYTGAVKILAGLIREDVVGFEADLERTINNINGVVKGYIEIV